MLTLLDHSRSGQADDRAQYLHRYRHRSGTEAIAEAATAAAAALAEAPNARASSPATPVRHRADSGDKRNEAVGSPDATAGPLLDESVAVGREEGSDGPSASPMAIDERLEGGGRGGEVDDKQQRRTHEAPDEAYMHSLGYGNLGSVLPILLDRRRALEVRRAVGTFVFGRVRRGGMRKFHIMVGCG